MTFRSPKETDLAISWNLGVNAYVVKPTSPRFQ